jgi:hypothetical protein
MCDASFPSAVYGASVLISTWPRSRQLRERHSRSETCEGCLAAGEASACREWQTANVRSDIMTPQLTWPEWGPT